MATSASNAEWRINVGADETIAAVFSPASTAANGAVFVCAHGAGGHMSDKSILAVSDELRRRGLHVVRFNFPYREKHSNRPDSMPRLMASIAAVAAHVRREVSPRQLFLGGRSMGGRAASMLAADGFACDGLLLLAYPLHPAGQPDKLRVAHLERIKVPVLCLNGTRDALCEQQLMTRAIAGLTDFWTMHWLQGADHSFHVLKSSGRTDAGVLDEAGAAYAAWQTGLRRARS
jgi:predicted alpha/beta-hydrolase family hydrolase